MAEVAVGIDISSGGEARKKKRSSRRAEAGDEAGERRHRRKKSTQQPGDADGGGDGDGERRKKKKKNREDETPEEKEERRRRRREKKQAKAEAEAAAAAAAAAPRLAWRRLRTKAMKMGSQFSTCRSPTAPACAAAAGSGGCLRHCIGRGCQRIRRGATEASAAAAAACTEAETKAEAGSQAASSAAGVPSPPPPPPPPPPQPQQQFYPAESDEDDVEAHDARDPNMEQPPIPEGKKPGGGLLGRLFASFRRGGSTKRKGSTASAKKAPGTAMASPGAGGAPSTSAESAGLGEHDRWNSNPGLFNANDTPGNTFDQRLQQPPQQPVALRQPVVPGVRPLADTEVRVILLDGEEIGVPIPRKATGSELMARVCEHIDLQEIDYFGLTYVDGKERMWFWLDCEKRVLKQLKHCENRMLNFQVKFYPPEPNMLMTDVTRYQLCLQVRQDIYTGKLPCTWVTQALLGSFQVQSELGDFDQAEHGDIGTLDYLQNFEFVHNQTPELVNKIAELHRGHKGITPEVADLRYLETARRLEFYGVDLHPARDLDDVDITLSGKNLFYLKIRSDLYENVEAVVGFKMMNHRWAKRLWKIAIENHSFFRLKEVQMEKSSSKLSLNFHPRHRFSGRTMHQYRAEGGTMRQSGTFDRSLSKRMSASLPSLKGSQYGSFHSLNRLHPRDMRPQASGGGGGGGGRASMQGPPRTAGRTASVSVLPTAAFSRDRPSTRSSSTANDDIL
uniref:FERM domain-containing protein n=1 Tax=Macrostomum lignano TaxID=282301 RepID=A0A1I8I905_9PLAT